MCIFTVLDSICPVKSNTKQFIYTTILHIFLYKSLYNLRRHNKNNHPSKNLMHKLFHHSYRLYCQDTFKNQCFFFLLGITYLYIFFVIYYCFFVAFSLLKFFIGSSRYLSTSPQFLRHRSLPFTRSCVGAGRRDGFLTEAMWSKSSSFMISVQVQELIRPFHIYIFFVLFQLQNEACPSKKKSVKREWRRDREKDRPIERKKVWDEEIHNTTNNLPMAGVWQQKRDSQAVSLSVRGRQGGPICRGPHVRHHAEVSFSCHCPGGFCCSGGFCYWMLRSVGRGENYSGGNEMSGPCPLWCCQ